LVIVLNRFVLSVVVLGRIDADYTLLYKLYERINQPATGVQLFHTGQLKEAIECE